jgi:hypothetical protein
LTDEPGKLTLRDESRGKNHRFLCAYCDERGNLHVDGQDLGPLTAPISDDGEYEWWQTIDASHLPALVQALGGQPGEPILTVLARYCGDGSYDFERILRESGIPVERKSWTG